MAEDVAGKFKEAGIVPDVLDKAPTEKLEVLFPGKPAVNLGDTFHTLDVRHAPKVSYPGKEGHYYSLIMIDPDNLSRENPCQAEWIQWMVLNIPYDAISAGMMSRHLVGYMIPGPQPRTGLHRFVFLLFEHHMRKLNQPSIKSRAKFKVREFMAKHKLSKQLKLNKMPAANVGNAGDMYEFETLETTDKAIFRVTEHTGQKQTIDGSRFVADTFADKFGSFSSSEHRSSRSSLHSIH
ncbi:phosphatidylethanolamine-binding protein [Trichinella nativa]|uniref:Phosphatidylethanolamine-binding protein n=1 Tax=Trichinella nativa TaxID=6335 RepID=A0A1Y3EP06_9BILA|nr:phosphatidylethanolamine-binding protein [Trichinella nativa]